jgi:hypothetical protein
MKRSFRSRRLQVDFAVDEQIPQEVEGGREFTVVPGRKFWIVVVVAILAAFVGVEVALGRDWRIAVFAIVATVIVNRVAGVYRKKDR